MKFQLTTLGAVLCFQLSAFSMFNCDCSWEIDMVCIQTDEGNIIPFPNACWAECLGYGGDQFIDCSYDINYDPNCGCSFTPDPVCVSANTGEVVIFPNSCWAECVGYAEDSFLNCQYNLPNDPSCSCDYEIDEVCVEVEEDIILPFPNACWAACAGYTENQFLDCAELAPGDIAEPAQYFYELLIEGGEHNGNLHENDSQQYNVQPPVPAITKAWKLNSCLIKEADIFPNPAEGRLYVKLNLDRALPIRLDIISREGVTYQSINQKASKGLQVVNIDTSELPKGLYLLQVYADRESQSLMFVKNKLSK